VIRTVLSPALLINLRSLYLQALLWVGELQRVRWCIECVVNNASHPETGEARVLREEEDNVDKPLLPRPVSNSFYFCLLGVTHGERQRVALRVSSKECVLVRIRGHVLKENVWARETGHERWCRETTPVEAYTVS